MSLLRINYTLYPAQSYRTFRTTVGTERVVLGFITSRAKKALKITPSPSTIVANEIIHLLNAPLA